MPCHFPIKGFRAKRRNPSGKYSMVMSPRLGNSDQPMEVPCGRCIGCRLERSRQWAIRCHHELQLYPQNAFLTLTYRPEEEPPNGSLNKSHLQKFFKRYRRWLGSHKIRYLACGEYGEKGDRPHYHAIVFNHDFRDKVPFKKIGGNQYYISPKLEQLWTHGHCIIGEANFQTAAYVARYVTKKITGPMAEDHYGVIINEETGEITPRRIPEYISPSRNPGLGRPWLDKFAKEVYPRDEVLVRGLLMKPPKFYDRIHESIDDCEHAEIVEARRLAAKQNPDNTWERRLVLSKIAAIKALQLKRKLES